MDSSDDDASSTPPPCSSSAHISKTPSSTRGLSALDYPRYMARLLATEELTPLSSPGASSAETSPTIKGNVSHVCKKKKKDEWREALGPLQCERNCSDHYEMASLMKVGQQRTEKFLAFEIIIKLFPCFLFL